MIDSSKQIGIALDPIHIGTGGYRIGRVDNSVLRDFDNVPKIPGTALAGAVRSYASMQFPEKRGCAGKDDISNDRGRQCGKYNCPICVTFGYTRDSSSRNSMVSFTDAQILFFPVSTMVGPVWVTSPQRLLDFTDNSVQCSPADDTKICAVSTLKVPNGRLNLGWTLFDKDVTPLDLSESVFSKIPDSIKRNAVCVSDRFFPLIVNTNLEVRTSVSIDPFTGAALDKALFTYEGVPRTSIFWFRTYFQDYSYFDDNAPDFVTAVKEKINDIDTGMIAAEKMVVRLGMEYLKSLGIGGMGTRGFGRLEVMEVAHG